MMSSHIKALGRNFYAAGRDAGKGKGDLEAYLEAHPDEAIPNGLLGAYLYFTDAVPKLFQFLSKLLFLPAGDRGRGLAMIDRSVAVGSPVRVDFEVLDANVTFFFEGRLEEGLRKYGDLLARYPRYPRLAVADAMIGPLDPLNGGMRLARVEEVVGRLSGETAVDTVSLWTVRAFRTWTLRYRSGNDLARPAFEELAAAAPAHPDWVEGFARFQLAQLDAATGRRDDARQQAETILADDRHGRFHDQARRLLEDLERIPDAPEVFDESLVAAVYEAGPDSLVLLAEKFETMAPSSVRAAFYAAECRLRAGDGRAAVQGYRVAHALEVPVWDEPFRMLAAWLKNAH